MSRFWQYFHDKLNWFPIHRPGPLAAIAKGLAKGMDACQKDILWLRDQWHPAKCEMESVPGYGKSRFLARHPKETDDQFRERVTHAWAWHQLGGRVEGLPKILEFYGFEAPEIVNMRRLLPSRWATFQLAFKTPATQAGQQALLENLDSIIWLVNEYKPARSLLYRVYTGACNFEPQVWSWGYWSRGYWSNFSGTPYPDSDGKGEIIVSFGMMHRVRSEAFWSDAGVGCWRGQDRAFRIFVNPRPIWSISLWSEKIFQHKVFAAHALIPLHGCELVWSREEAWPDAAWPMRPWAQDVRWDRRLPKWGIKPAGIYKSQGVYSDFTLIGNDWLPEGRWTAKPWGDLHYYKEPQAKNLAGGKFPPSAWSAPNCNWSWPVSVTTTYDEPVWSETDWSCNTGRKEHYEIIEEQFYDCRFALVNPPQQYARWQNGQWEPKPWWREIRHVSGRLDCFGRQTLGSTLKNNLAPVWSESGWSGFYPRRYGSVASFGHLAMAAPHISFPRGWEDKAWPHAVWEGPCHLALAGDLWPEEAWRNTGWGAGLRNLAGKGAFSPARAHGALAEISMPPGRMGGRGASVLRGRDDSWQGAAWQPLPWGRLPASLSGSQLMSLHGKKSETRPASVFGGSRALAGQGSRANPETCVHISRALFADGLNARSWQGPGWADEPWWLPPEANQQTENSL